MPTLFFDDEDGENESPLLTLVGRVLLSGIFLMSGTMKFVAWDQTAQYMAAQHMTMIPLFLASAAIVEIAGGLSLLFGWKAKWGAALLAVYLIPVTLVFHHFWDLTGLEQQTQIAQFMKNLAIMGGLWVVVAHREQVQAIGMPVHVEPTLERETPRAA